MKEATICFLRVPRKKVRVRTGQDHDSGLILFSFMETRKPLLSLIRHPETVANVSNILQGSTDSPLSVHGMSQLEALITAIRNARTDGNIPRKAISPLLNPSSPPSHIFTSPLNRAFLLADALFCVFEETSQDKLHHTKPVSIIFEKRQGLAEKDFGKNECTRRGIHVDGFPKGFGPSETNDAWVSRVMQEGNRILALMSKDDSAASHIIVVTHGLWIGTFCRLFLKETDKIPFLGNTAILSLQGHLYEAVSPSPTMGLRLSVVQQNDVSHLSGLKRQRGGIGSSASDKRQKTLDSIWRVPKKGN